MPVEHKSQLIVAVLSFACVVITTVSSNWDKWFSRSVPTPVVTSTPVVTAMPPETPTPPANPTPRIIPTPRVTPFPPYTPSPRVTVTPSATVTPPAALTPPTSPTPRGTPPLRVTPTPPATTTSSALIPPSARTTAAATTTRITSPHHGATVGQRIAVEGVLTGLRPEQQVFLCVKSQAFGRLIYPQGKAIPDATGQWTVDSIYGSAGYSYETFQVVTTNAEAAAMLSDQHARKYGMRDLPPGTEPLGTAIVVTRE
jgi:hypothetical protein